jgi:hypothetical protein
LNKKYLIGLPLHFLGGDDLGQPQGVARTMCDMEWREFRELFGGYISDLIFDISTCGEDLGLGGDLGQPQGVARTMCGMEWRGVARRSFS